MFLEGVPISGLAICYAPLLITVLGFIVFAALTDVDARRSYLRRDVGTFTPPSQPIIAETPSGAEVIIGVNANGNGGAVAPAPAKPAPAKPAPKAPPPSASASEDDLKTIEGIGPKVESALKESGITTFAQLATMSADDLVRIVKEEKGVRIVGDAATWAKQAQFLVDGDEAGLQAYQDRLVGGREPKD